MIESLPANSGGGGGGGGGGNGGPASRVGRGIALHRSNSSLELPHGPDPTIRIPETPLRREYGSHGMKLYLYLFVRNNLSSFHERILIPKNQLFCD